MRITLFPLLISLIFTVLFSCKPAQDKSDTKPTQTTKETASVKETKATEVKLSVEEMSKLNTFFSNFSEVNLKPFTEGKITDEELISFGILHIIRNNKNMIEKSDAVTSRIKEENVTTSIQKYFGKIPVNHKSTGEFILKNGYYIFPLADGEAFTFSQVERLTDIGSDKYVAYINVYTAGSGWTGNTNGTMTEWKSNGNEVPELTGKFKATFEKKNTGNVLIDYVKQ